jgi:hypothetical protein
MSQLSASASVVVAAPPEAVYDLVADVTRTGEWSPVCQTCWWDEGDGPRVGSWFTGRNVTPQRTWETRSEVVAAERPREFAWKVGGRFARWGYALEAVEGGTLLTESWEFLPAGLELFAERYGADADVQVEERSQSALRGIPETLAAVKRIAEGG